MSMVYHVIEEDNRLKLSKEVNRYIGHGWIPLGGVAVSASPSIGKSDKYVQAMTKDEMDE